MLVKELLEYRHYTGEGGRSRKPAFMYDTNGGDIKTRKRISKKPTKSKRRYDNLINAKKRKRQQAIINQQMMSSS